MRVGKGARPARRAHVKCYCIGSDRDRGEPRGPSPPTPPCVRVRTRRFGGLCGLPGGEGSEAERGEEGIWQGDVKRGG
jgi:hypothetical protein